MEGFKKTIRNAGKKIGNTCGTRDALQYVQEK